MLFLASTSAFEEINNFETSTCPALAETCNGVSWLKTEIKQIQRMNMESVIQIARIRGLNLLLLASTSAFEEINRLETSRCPFEAELCNEVRWLQNKNSAMFFKRNT